MIFKYKFLVSFLFLLLLGEVGRVKCVFLVVFFDFFGFGIGVFVFLGFRGY